MSHAHVSVLLAEAVEALNIQPDGIYVDATFGRGGHSRAILERLGPNGSASPPRFAQLSRSKDESRVTVRQRCRIVCGSEQAAGYAGRPVRFRFAGMPAFGEETK